MNDQIVRLNIRVKIEYISILCVGLEIYVCIKFDYVLVELYVNKLKFIWQMRIRRLIWLK